MDTVDRMVGDALQDMAHVEFRIEIVEFGRTEVSLTRSSWTR